MKHLEDDVRAFVPEILRHPRSTAVVGITLWTVGMVGSAALGGCGGGVRPYRAMAKAAASEESAEAQAHDKRLTLQVREALLETDAAAVGHVSPHVYMDRVFLVGFVESEDQRSRLGAAAKGVEGVREVDAYLPLKSADTEVATSVAANIAHADHVTSFLLLPDPDYEKRLRHLLRD